MNIIRKICTITIIIVMLINTAILSFADESKVVSTSTSTKAYLVVNGLGILKGLTVSDPNAIMNGGDFTMAMSNTMGCDASNVCASIIDNESVKCVEAMKIFVDLLGYEVIANKDGGYPIGYLTQALKLKLFKDLTLEAGQAITYSDFAQILYNALEVDLLQLVTIGESKKYETEEGKNLLSEVMGLEKIEGQITANNITGFKKMDGVGKNCIEIDGRPFNLADDQVSVNKMIGRYVEAYYTTSKNKRSMDADTVVYVQLSDKYETKTIDAKDIKAYYNYNLQYTENDDERSITIPKDAYVIYNGVVMSQYDNDTFKFFDGTVELVSGPNEQYGTIVITDYADFIVGAIDEDKHMFYNKLFDSNHTNEGSFIQLDESDLSNSIFIRDTDGKELKTEDIRVGDVLSVAKNGAYADIIISRNKLKDFIISEIEEDEEGAILSSKDSKLRISKYLENSPELININVGDKIDVLLDAFGKAALITLAANAELSAGYLVKTNKSTSGVDPAVQLKVFRSDGIMVILDVAENTTIWDSDGGNKRYKKAEAFEIMKNYSGILSYKLNNEKCVSEIILPLTNYNPDMPDRVRKLARNPKVKYTFKENPRTFGAQWFFASGAIVYSIPDDSQKDDDDAYDIKPVTYFSNDTDYNNIDVYSNDEDGVLINYVVLSGVVSKMNASEHAVVVRSVSNSINEDGDKCKTVRGVKDGTAVTLISKTGSNGKTAFDEAQDIPTGQPHLVKEGDIIMSHVDKKGNVDSAKILFRPDEVNPSFPNGQKGNLLGATGSIGSDSSAVKTANPFATNADFVLEADGRTYNSPVFRVFYGWAYKKNSSIVTLTNQDLTCQSYVGFGNSGQYYVENYNVGGFGKFTNVEYKNGKVNARIGSYDDINTYKDAGASCSRVIAIVRWGQPQQLIVINGEME